ncbi:sle1_087 (plasmid) [Streptomyces leeuwenhoekii]|uniref:Sle1_087 protein n=2 Tax=Streptomyces leeuwenhoekii TaxID=1437453 RepID=A0A0F7VKK3_STRLW|nr:sle1_087 [Streptomyces leeuwenhoekii]
MLRSVPAPAQEQRPKRTFPEFVAAVYEDPRVGHETRELLLAIGYAVDLAKREDGVSPLKVARRKLGVDHGKARYDRLIADDAPRYKPPREAGDWYPSGAPSCEGPRLRPYRPRAYKPRAQAGLPEPTRLHKLPPTFVHVTPGYTPPRDWRTEDGVCGAQSHHRVLEKDPRTGWITARWFCKRHKDHADRVAEQVRAQNEQAPEPIPNTGGLLPCYFKADWEKVYRHYRPRWQPPKYGICADDWPSVDEMAARPSRHSRLRVLVGGVDLEDA